MKIKIEIIKSSNEKSWYADCIGKIYESDAYFTEKNDLVLKTSIDTGMWIADGDYKIIELDWVQLIKELNQEILKLQTQVKELPKSKTTYIEINENMTVHEFNLAVAEALKKLKTK